MQNKEPPPTGKAKRTRAAGKTIFSLTENMWLIIGLKNFLDVQFEKAARCNIDYDKAGLAEKKHALCFAYYASELIHLLYFCALCYNNLKR